MSLAEILPAVRRLPREEQMELVRVLTAELAARQSSQPESEAELIDRFIVPGATYDIYTPQFPPEAAEEVARLLERLPDLRQ